MPLLKRVFLIFLLLQLCLGSFSQETPLSPVSFRLFTPFVFNPAIAGSKDFLSADMITSFHGKDYAAIISANTRLMKKQESFVSSTGLKEFTRIGTGISVFSENMSLAASSGASAAFSYHIPLNSRNLSFLSVGASAKAYRHSFDGDTSLGFEAARFSDPGADAGIYYYSPRLYAGFSVTNIFSAPPEKDSIPSYRAPWSRHFYFNAGYKFIVSRSMNLVVEPSILLISGDTMQRDLKKWIKPALKIYAGDFLLGTYLNDFDNLSFFFQFRYPRFYAGTYFEFPRHTSFYRKTLTVEVAAGINLWGNKSGYSERSRW
ncbi:MAG: PorP/SprF family type IX secretion system membrane protein [Bacteroidales bacterium]|nr:PorP/SprF family type IX secretion system membrane protein [Bacteroidales bacterium]